MTESIQFEFLFEQDLVVLSPMALHEKLMAGSVSWARMERIAVGLPDADRLVAC